MSKTFTDLKSARPKVESIQIAVDDAFNLTTLTAVIGYDVLDSTGATVSNNRVKVDILAKLGVAARTALAGALKNQLTVAVNEYV